MLVAHMKKSETEDKPSGKMGIKGSGGITDMVSTVVEVWRNKPRERAILRSQQPDAGPLDEKYTPTGPCGAGTMLLVLKQNATGEEPSIRLWFDQDSTQFLAGPDHTARPMLEFYA
jgi:twinkle protein